MFSAPPNRLGWWVTHGERLGLVSAIREIPFGWSCGLGHATRIAGPLKEKRSGRLFAAIERVRAVMLDGPRVLSLRVQSLVDGHAARLRDRSERDRKSTRLNSSHLGISHAVVCFK